MIDYMIMEAVAVKADKQEDQARKDAEQKAWKKDEGGINRLREIAGG